MDVSTQALSWREAAGADFAVIGESVSHSFSPAMQNAAFEHLGLEHYYVAIDVPRGEVHQALDHLRHRGFLGINVTVPHKEEVIGWLRELEPTAQYIGAVNTIGMETRYGWNTDIHGALATLEAEGIHGGHRALLVGAGGAARAVCAAFNVVGVEWAVCNRSRFRADELASHFSGAVADELDPSDWDLIVNCTPSSKERVDLGIDWRAAKPTIVVWDLFYGSGLTHFLQQPAELGLRTVDGLPMLVHQGVRSLTHWLPEIPTDGLTDVMFAAVNREVAARA